LLIVRIAVQDNSSLYDVIQRDALPLRGRGNIQWGQCGKVLDLFIAHKGPGLE
jgi:hypothetical protein